jgi:glycosyltransferase involved in cell wall biosynthesis
VPVRPDVALIAPYPPRGERHGGHSGVASYTANLAHAIAERGVGVTVVAPIDGDGSERYADGRVDVRRCFRLGRRALPVAVGAAAATGAAVVHLQFELFLYGGAASLFGLPAALGRARWALDDAALVTTLHQVVDPAAVDADYARLHRVGVPASVASAGIAAVQSAVARASAATIVHEDAFRRIVPTATVIPHGVERVVPVERSAARRRLGLDDRFVVLCFGFLAPYKGLEFVLAAARHARPGVHVVVAGGEHPRMQGTDGFAATLTRAYADAATFTGWVADDDVTAWFSAADVAVFPYPRPFSSSGALALALAHGTPALLSPPLARHVGAPSVMAVPLEPKSMAGRLDDLAATPPALDELRRWSAVLTAGRRWPAVAAAHTSVYEEVMGDGERAACRRLRAG